MLRVRGRSAWAVPLLLFLGVVLVASLAFNLANLDPGQEAIPDVQDAGGTPPTSTSLIDFLPLLYVAMATLAVLFLAVYVYLLKKRRRGKAHATLFLRRNRLIQSLVLFLLFVLLAMAWRGAGPAAQDESEPPPGNASEDEGFPALDLPRIAGIPLTAFLAAGLLVSFLLLVFLLRGAPPARAGLGSEPVRLTVRQEAAATVGETIRRLELGGDVRGAILLCFHRFCELLGARGVVRQDVLTPREIEGLAVRTLSVSGSAAEALTSLFEEARYSEHALDEADRQRAVASLDRIRAVLEA